MPLPANGITWPPSELTEILETYRAYDAWFTGNTDDLKQIYSTGSSRPSQYAGGVVGAVSRFFWGKPDADVDTRMHAPLAADICRVNSDLLFSDPITATVDDEGTQVRLDLITDTLHAVLVGAAELSAALGGTYLRATWDTSVSSSAFITKVDADMAWPEFRWGRLTAVTFWRTVHTENSTVWRHLERHETNNGVGVIVHGLYEGNADNLGSPRPFEDRSETAWLAGQQLIDGNTISTVTPGLDVAYVRNLEQAKLWRKHPLGANLGRSDLEGLIPDLDAYDKAYTSLMQDLEDGKSRLIVAESMLTDFGPGKGAGFDNSRRLFTGLNMPPGKADGASVPIEQVQFKIRVEEHLAVMESILHRVIRSAGYSPRSFGLDDSDVAKTATEVNSEDGLSGQTRKRKIRAFEQGLEAILSKALAVDTVILNGGGQAMPVDVSFPDATRESPQALAQIVQTLRVAKAASTKTLVSIYNPAWNKEEIDAEVDLIMREDKLDPLADPDARPFGTELEGTE